MEEEEAQKGLQIDAQQLEMEILDGYNVGTIEEAFKLLEN